MRADKPSEFLLRANQHVVEEKDVTQFSAFSDGFYDHAVLHQIPRVVRLQDKTTRKIKPFFNSSFSDKQEAAAMTRFLFRLQ